MAAKMEATLQGFQELPQRVDDLQERWEEVKRLYQQEQTLRKQLVQYRDVGRQLPFLEAQAQDLQERAKRAVKIEEICQALTEEIEAIPDLEKRKAALEETAREYKDRAASIAAQEKKYERMIHQLQEREGWLSLAQLEQSIAQARDELDQISRQLGEKRSLLDRMIRRKQEEVQK